MLVNLFRSGMGFREIVIYLLLFIPIFLISFSVHEAAHAYVAWKLGDPTARNMGRLTLNPLKHLDPIGTISMLLIGIGYGKPVPINSRYFKNPKRDMAISAAAGPISNLLLAFLGTLLYNLTALVLSHAYPAYDGLFQNDICPWDFGQASANGAPAGIIIGLILLTFFYYFSWMNVSLCVFNLIPIPPFDGSRILFAFLPDRYYWGIQKYEWIIMIVIIVVLFLLPFNPVTPIAEAVQRGLYLLTRWIARL